VPTMVRFKLGAVVLIGVLVILAAMGQETRGSILGRVTDTSGAIIPGATVVLVNQATGVTSSTGLTVTGEYTFINLDPGQYRVTATAIGFRKTVVQDVTLFVAQKARVDVTLDVGDISTAVEVRASVSVVQSEQASVGSVVDSKQIMTMPLNGRSNLYGLMALAPGYTRASVNALIAGGTWAGSVNMTVDGASNTDVGGARLLPIAPSLESLSEFSVVSNGTSAEYGRGGAQIIVATKSGTNEVHGTVFAFNRNRVTAAKNFFATGLPKPTFNRNEYGFSVGGPVIKNKLFYFGTYEGLQQRNAGTSFVAMPTVALKNGNFTGLPAVRDPNANQAPFPGNQIPVQRFSSVSTELLKYATDPNTPGTGAAGLGNNLVVNIPTKEFNDRYTVRLDYELSSKDRISGRYFQVDNGPYIAAGGGTDRFGNWGGNGTATKNVIGSYSRILTPTLITEGRFAIQFANLYRTPQNGDLDPSKLIPGLTPPLPGLGGLPTVTIVGFRGFDDRPGSGDRATRYEYFQNATWIKGAHTVKAGYEFQRTSANNWQNVAPFRGNFRFDGRYAGHAFADFLLGTASQTGRANKNAEIDMVNNRWSAFVQDDWKATRNLTVNYGVRYDFYGLFSNSQGDMSTFDPSLNKVVLISGVPDQRLLDTLPTVLGKEIGITRSNWYNNDRNNFAPRFGFAYRPFHSTKLVIRSAYGIYFNDPGGYSFLGMVSNPPFIVSETYDALSGNVPSLTFSNPFPGSGTIPVGPRVAGWAKDRVTPYQQQWNFTLESEIMRNTGLRVSYIGNLGLHLDRVMPLNDPLPGPGNIQLRRPVQPFGPLNYQETGRNSILHALQAGVIRRYSNGVSFQMEYQFNRALGENTFASQPMDFRNARLDRGNLDYVRRHVMTANYVYDLPFGKGKTLLGNAAGPLNLLVSGWQMSGILSVAAGEPYSVTFTSTVVGWPSSRADLVGDPNVDNPTVGRWFNPAAFSVPGQFLYGNSARNLLFGPGYFTWDAGLFKNTALTERLGLEFRAETFNLPNRANFGLPASNISVPATVGLVNSAADARTFQFGLRLRF
jgi:hypothetical protein